MLARLLAMLLPPAIVLPALSVYGPAYPGPCSRVTPHTATAQDRAELDRGRVYALRGLSGLVMDLLRDASRDVVHVTRGTELPFLQTA